MAQLIIFSHQEDEVNRHSNHYSINYLSHHNRCSAIVIHHLLMASWGVGENSTFCDDKPIIQDMVHDFSEDDEHDDNFIPTSLHILINPSVELLKLFNLNCVKTCVFTQNSPLYSL